MASDVEMGDAGPDQHSDDRSLLSTPVSSAASEYDVEEILAERKVRGKTEYLIKWLGYIEERSDWEPEENLNSPEILASWARKKADIKAKKKPPFDVKGLEARIKQIAEKTKERKKVRQARRIERNMRLKSIIIFSDDENSNHSALEPQGGGDGDDIDDLFVVTSINNSEDLSSQSQTKGLNTTSTTLDHPTTGTAEAPIKLTQAATTESKSPLGATRASPGRIQATAGASQTPTHSTQDLQGRPKASLGVQETIQPAADISQSLQSSTQPTNPPNPKSKTSQGAARRTSTSTKSSSNGITRFQAHPPSNLPGFGNASLAPAAKNTARHVNTKWFGRGSKWGRDQAPDASELQLLKPSEFSPLKNPQGNIPPITTQITSEQSSGVGNMTSGNPSPSRTRPTESHQFPKDQPTTDNPKSTSSSHSDQPLQYPRAMDPDIEVPRLSDQVVGRDFSSRLSNPSRPVSDKYRPLGRSTARRSIKGSNRPFEAGPLETQPPRDSYRPSNDLWPLQGPNRSRGYHNRSSSPPSSPSQNASALALDFRRHSMISRIPTSGAHTKSNPINSRYRSSPTAVIPVHALNKTETLEEEILRMPVGIPTQDSIGLWLRPFGHFWNPGEVYAHVFYGPDKIPVGAVRVCGMSFEVKRELLSSKAGKSNRFEMWFKDLCNGDQYAELCQRVIV